MGLLTSGYETFLPDLRGESDGTPKTPEWAAAICLVKADKIRELAELCATNQTMICTGWSQQRAEQASSRPGCSGRLPR